MSLTITHTYAQGTMINGTSRGDGSAEVLKTIRNPHTGRSAAWRWSRNLGSWYVQRSRDTRANTALIEATRRALEAKGFVVHVSVDDTYRSAAEVEADRLLRQEQRVGALEAKAARKADAAENAETRARELSEGMPLGQPILVDHYSAPRLRKAYEKIEKAARESLAAHADAKMAAHRADAASHTTAVRYSAPAIRRRLERLGEELRRYERVRDGHTRTLFTDGRGVKHVETVGRAEGVERGRILREIARVKDEIGYWQGELGTAADAGAELWDARTIEVGDKIRCPAGWVTVTRVNAKSVQVAERRGRLPFDRITGVESSDGQRVRIVAGTRVVGAGSNGTSRAEDTAGGRCDECGYPARDEADALDHQQSNPSHRWAIERIAPHSTSAVSRRPVGRPVSAAGDGLTDTDCVGRDE